MFKIQSVGKRNNTPLTNIFLQYYKDVIFLPNTIYTIGEALIDFIPTITDTELKDVPQFKRVMGGAPANVAVAAAKLGGQTSFISKLGDDAFGNHITEQLEKHAVDTRHLVKTTEANTGLAFVSLKKDGQRDFSFYRKPSADMLLTADEVKDIPFDSSDILHFCSVDLIDAPVKKAHQQVIEQAIAAGGLVSFDPNVRLPLWDSSEACREAINEFLPYAHVVKVSDEELAFITGIEDEEEALKSLFTGNVECIIYTLGAKGAIMLLKNGETFKHTGFQVQAIDTTGAGDAFVGATLFQLQKFAITQTKVNQIELEQGTDILAFSNSFAALTTLKNGAVDALPSYQEAEQFLAEKKK